MSEPLSPPFIDALRSAVGAEHALLEDDQRAPYETDWTRRFGGRAAAVVRPGTTEETAQVVRLCHEAGVAVVPQGGNTGLVGGSVPRGGELVLSLRRLQELHIDAANRQALAGAGVTLERLQQEAAAHGLTFGVDMASRGSATLGGMVATNAGGMHVLRYGPMRSQVLGYVAVLADGSVIERLRYVAKESAGFEPGALLPGSEGTLAVVTGVLVRLVPAPRYAAVALLGLERLQDAIEAVRRARERVPSLQAAEVFFAEGMALVREHAGLPAPLQRDYPVYLLLEAAGDTDPAEELAAALEDVGDAGAVAFATGTRERERLWAYRERHTEAVNAAGVPHKLDVAVPLAEAARFEAELRRLFAEEAPTVRPILWGHLAEGNFHVNLLGLAPDDERVDVRVLELVASLGGTISSEHGVGVAKARYLHLSRSAAELEAMRAIKKALDPRGILNPGVILPVERVG